MSEIEMYDSKSHNKRCNQTNQKAWLMEVSLYGTICR
jgi:hypothetical protein